MTDPGHNPAADPAAFPEMVCATCLEPLNHRTGFDGTDLSYSHAPRRRADDPQPDHEPHPIPMAEATHINYMCDFCSTFDRVNWVYSTGRVTGHATAAARPTGEKVGKERALGKTHYSASQGRNLPEYVTQRYGAEAEVLAANNFSPNWTACDPCSAVIELDDIERLITHLRRTNPDTAARTTRTLLRAHFAEFFKLKQPRQPIESVGGKTTPGGQQ